MGQSSSLPSTGTRSGSIHQRRNQRPSEQEHEHESADNDSEMSSVQSTAVGGDLERRRSVFASLGERLRRSREDVNSSNFSPEANGNEDTDEEQQQQHESWILPTSRRRRRTNSSDEMRQETDRKRRQRSTLRRLTRFGSSVVSSITGNEEAQSSSASSSSSSPPVATSHQPSASNPVSTTTSSTGHRDSAASYSRQDSLPSLSSGIGRGAFGRDSILGGRDSIFGGLGLNHNNRHGTNRGLRTLGREPPGFESQAAMLSRLLAIAASVTASSLIGGGGSASGSSSSRASSGFNIWGRDRQNSNAESTSESTNAAQDDSSNFTGFLEELNNGLLANELNSEEGVPNPQHFFRMFRFASRETNSEGQNMVPVLIVGVRAVNDETEGGAGGANANGGMPGFPSFIDPSAAAAAAAAAGRSSRQNNEPQGAGTSTVSSSSSSSNNSSRSNSINRGQHLFDELDSESESENTNTGTATATTESNRPNHTGGLDDDFWRLYSSRSGRNSGRSLLDRLSSEGDDDIDEEWFDSLFSGRDNSESSTARTPRNRSNSQATAASGASGTRGSTSASSEHDGANQRRASWIIYIVGGTYPENHPILEAPTLFTDNPSYEDMMMLETFLGQVKKPTATKEEVESAGGLYKVGQEYPDGIDPRLGEQCLVCLSQYENGEEIRQLKSCGHAFHTECIDQWLVTGRNSCPLCRAEGVKKKAEPSKAKDEEGSSATASSSTVPDL